MLLPSPFYTSGTGSTKDTDSRRLNKPYTFNAIDFKILI